MLPLSISKSRRACGLKNQFPSKILFTLLEARHTDYRDFQVAPPCECVMQASFLLLFFQHAGPFFLLPFSHDRRTARGWSRRWPVGRSHGRSNGGGEEGGWNPAPRRFSFSLLSLSLASLFFARAAGTAVHLEEGRIKGYFSSAGDTGGVSQNPKLHFKRVRQSWVLRIIETYLGRCRRRSFVYGETKQVGRVLMQVMKS